MDDDKNKPVVIAPATAPKIKAPDSEPVAPKHLRLESGTMHELMEYVKAWLAWDSRQTP